MDIERARTIALNGHHAEEYEHFGKPAYRIAAKKAGAKPGRTFMSLWPEEGHAVLMLNVEQQAELVTRYPKAFAPHPSEWGAKGATIAQLAELNELQFGQALALAVQNAVR
jgi:hypothetical protein